MVRLDLIKENFLWTCLPVTNQKKIDFLNLVNSRVEYYQPKIEERCGVNLGAIKIRDNKLLLSDVVADVAYREAIRDAWRAGRVPTERDFLISFASASVGELLFMPFVGLYNSFNGADFIYKSDMKTIYVPFNLINRLHDVSFGARINRMDYGVVHELSHALWGELADECEKYSFGTNIWEEGFATYCAENYFVDFYPKNVKKPAVLRKVYTYGNSLVEGVVEKYGEDILLEIPSRWREFAKLNSE